MQWSFSVPVGADALRRSLKDVSATRAISIVTLAQPSRSCISRLLRDGVLMLLIGLCLGRIAVHAQNADWSPAPLSGDWNTDANWVPPPVPTGTATFGLSSNTAITVSASASVGTLQFNAGAPAYSFTLLGIFRINAAGIVNNSSNIPSFSAPLGPSNVLSFEGANTTAGNATIVATGNFATEFHGASTAGNATITNNGGLTQFFDTSTAASSLITNNSGGQTVFSPSIVGTSTAGNATIINNFGGSTLFGSTSTAGAAAITNNLGGFTEFFAASTAANATITTNSGGSTLFVNTSTGGQSRFITNAGGTVDISGLSSPGMTAGSIEGAGTYQLGSKALTVGSNNLSTEVSGTIDGGTGGALIKVGTGTLTLTGTNSYTGGTTILAGTLQLGNGSATGSIVGAVVNSSTFDIFNANTLGITTITTNTGATTNFLNTSTAGAATITNSGGLTRFSGTSTAGAATIANDGGLTQFSDTSTAGAAAIVNNGGLTQFFDTSTAANSAITSNSGGVTDFSGASTAGTATIINNGGLTKFFDTSTAGAATITTNSGGSTLFYDTSTGGQARFITNAGGIVDISSLTSGGMTAGSIEGAGTYHLGSKALTVGLNNLSTEVSGIIADGGVAGGTGGALIKVGTGTLTLTGLNTYSGGTSFNGGILAVNSDANLGTGPLSFDGGTLQALAVGDGINSSKGITLNPGGGTFSADAGSISTLSGAISGAGALTKDGPGTLTLTGKNTYTGGTVLSAGTLTVNGAQALGLGDVTVNGGTLNADPQPINVKGNYTQNAGGTLQLQVAGANPGQYDSLNVGGNAALGGTLQLISLGFQPKAGNQLTLVTTGGVVSSRFAQFVEPFAPGQGFNTVNLVYGRNSVLLKFLNLPSPVPPVIVTTDFSSFALTPNERAAAHLLDAVQLDPRATDLISFLDKEPFANLPGDFEKISPDGLTAFYEISFSSANIQRLNLEGRLDDIRNGSNGFSSNMKVNGARVNLEDKAGVDGKSSKGVVEPILQPGPENRWGVWVTGFGDFVNVGADGNAKGYDFTTGGVSLGIDYRITGQLAIGVMGDYSHTWTALNPSGHIDVDSGRGGLYATWYNHGIYLNGAIYGGHNTYDSNRSSLGGLANGGTEGAEWSTFVSGGYDFHFGHLTVGPIAALQYTYVNIDGFSEKGSLAPMQIHSGSAESLRSDVGFRVFYQWQIGKILVEPSLKAAWEHEYKYSALPITAGFAGIPGPSATFFGSNEGHDSAVVSAGVSAQLTPAISIYVNYDGQLGREHYDSNAVTGGARISF